MKGLLLVERFILETLGSEQMTINEIEKQTRLNFGFIKNILSGLVYKNIVIYNSGFYWINKEKKSEIVKEINSRESVKGEIKELFISFVNEFYMEEKKKMRLHVKKVFLDKIEERVLESHMQNLNDFFKGLTPKKKKDTASQRVVMWGECNYLDLVNQSLSYA